MQVGMIGLGRMGGNMVQRLMQGGHECVVYARRAEALKVFTDQGVAGHDSLVNLIAQLDKPRTLWIMLPTATVDDMLAQLAPLLDAGDILVDGGNSYYRDDIRRGAELAKKDLHYLDVGTSGGVMGLERGYCLMIGGEPEIAQYLDPIFATLAPGAGKIPPTPGRHRSNGTADRGYLHCGPHGAGHFVKMVHNGIEYGLMAAYAEGLNILHNADAGKRSLEADAETAPLQDAAYYKYELNVPEIAEVWRRGSVISSWLLDLTAAALVDDAELGEFSGRVSDSGEGRWTVQAAIDESVPIPVISAALFSRFSSRGEADYANKLLSAMRKQFGGHHEKPEKDSKDSR